ADPTGDTTDPTGFDLARMEVDTIADQFFITLGYTQYFDPTNPTHSPGPRGEILFDSDHNLLTGGWPMGAQIPPGGGDMKIFYDIDSLGAPLAGGATILLQPDSTGHSITFGQGYNDGRWVGQGNHLSLAGSLSLLDAFSRVIPTNSGMVLKRVPTDG